jgi:hypothetical protein
VLEESLHHQSLAHFNDKNLSVRERLAFIAASGDLVNAGLLSAGDYLNILGAMLADNHPRVVSSALGNLMAQSNVYITPANEAAWSRYVKQKAQAALTRFGLQSHANDPVGVDNIRRNLITLLAFEVKDPEQIATSKKIAERYLADPNSADLRLIDNHMAVAAFYGDEALFNKIKTTFESTSSPQMRTTLLSTLSMFGDQVLQLKSLDYLLTDKITASDMRYVFYGHMYREARFARMRAWLYQHYDEVVKKTPPFVVPSIPTYVGGGCDLTVYAEAEKFFSDKISAQPAYVRSLAKLKENVTTCANLRARESNNVNAMLAMY